jgi:Peptidase family C25
VICVIRPENDSVAKVLSNWWSLVPPSGYAASEVRGRGTTRKKVERELAGSSAVFYLGHGTETSLVGRENLMDARNIRLAAGKLVVAIACSSAEHLGDWAYKAGATGYLGFARELLSVQPYNDRFGRAAIAGISAVLTKRSLGNAAEEMKFQFAELAKYFETLDDWDGPFAQTLAEWDLHSVVAKGHLESILKEEPSAVQSL